MVRATDREYLFHSSGYLRINARRLEHLASLRIPVIGKTVLEVGAGLGDHSHYFLDRGCKVTITDARDGNLAYLQRRYPKADVCKFDLEAPSSLPGSPFEVVYCYGVLYHVSDPAKALDVLASHCGGVLLLETKVSLGSELEVHPRSENSSNPTEAASGMGCRPTRNWIFETLKARFEHVYLTLTHPNHEEFPVDWDEPVPHPEGLYRTIFVASRTPLDNPLLVRQLISRHSRHE